ncbi:MAG: glycosyltransferase, partial [Thermoplasmata archaeon]|nr:glycosyltransferase [Thermoplasmata archaeon]
MTSGKRVLVISYLFPPLDCGVCRQAKLVKYLPKYGWRPYVITVKRSFLRPLYDDFLLSNIPPEAVVRRTPTVERISRPLGGLPAVGKLFRTPDPYVSWTPFAVREGLRLIKREKIDLIFSTSLPNTNHVVGYVLKRFTGLPWVADFRESWTLNPFFAGSDTLLRPLDELLERLTVEGADMITGINEEILGALREKYGMDGERFAVISHSFDPADFEGPRGSKGEKKRILYAGSFYERRRPDKLLFALKSLLEEDPEIAGTLEVTMVGNLGNAPALVERMGLGEVVRCGGKVSHGETFRLMRESDMLLLIIGEGKDAKQVSTGKLYEYIGSGVPIFAVIPEGEAARVIRETG